jgi:hypothetical protein
MILPLLLLTLLILCVWGFGLRVFSWGSGVVGTALPVLLHFRADDQGSLYDAHINRVLRHPGKIDLDTISRSVSPTSTVGEKSVAVSSRLLPCRCTLTGGTPIT